MKDTDYKKIVNNGKYLVTRRKTGGLRYFLAPKKVKEVPILYTDYEKTTGLKASESAFVFYKTSINKFTFFINTSLNPANSSDVTYVLPLEKYTPEYSMVVDWGDGTETLIPAGTYLDNISHTYSSSGAYTITLHSESGKMPVFNNSYNASVNYNNLKLVGITNPFLPFDSESPNYTNLSNCFLNSTNLHTLTGFLLKNNPQVTNYNYFLSNCERLLEIPEGIFNYATNTSSFEGTFANNPHFTTIPSGLMVNTIPTSLKKMFYGCKGIKDIIVMDWIFGSRPFNGTVDVSQMFYNCYNSFGNASQFVKFVNGAGMTDEQKREALYMCREWEDINRVDSIWTGQHWISEDWLALDSNKYHWLITGPDENVFIVSQ